MAIFMDLFQAMAHALKIGSPSPLHNTHTVILHWISAGIETSNPRKYFKLDQADIVPRGEVRDYLQNRLGQVVDHLEREIDPAEFDFEAADPTNARAVVYQIYSSCSPPFPSSDDSFWGFERPTPFALPVQGELPRVKDWVPILKMTLAKSKPETAWLAAVWMVESGVYDKVLADAGIVGRGEAAYQVIAKLWKRERPSQGAFNFPQLNQAEPSEASYKLLPSSSADLSSFVADAAKQKRLARIAELKAKSGRS